MCLGGMYMSNEMVSDSLPRKPSLLARARGRLRMALLRVLRAESSPQARWEAMQSSILASDADKDIVNRVRAYTMTGPLRLHALLQAVGYVSSRGLPGAFVECGVWRGGSVMAMLLKLLQMDVTDREVFLYDTFEGMTAPTAADTSPFEPAAAQTYDGALGEGKRGWDHIFGADVFSEAGVRGALQATSYPGDRLHFVRGPVEQTVPGTVPERIALLRLDTDWYESTRHELEHLYPRLVQGGVLIIDDYGHWEGCRKAVDEYFAREQRVLLNRIDYAGRIAVKV